jgi:uncharacterized protein
VAPPDSIDCPGLRPDTLRGTAGGRVWLWRAAARGGPTVLSEPAARLVDAWDGRRTLGEAAQAAGVAPERAQAVHATLVGRGLALWPAGVAPPPRRPEPRRLSLWWHVTNACNLACPHCYIATSAGEMSDEVAARGLELVLATCARRGLAEVEIKVAGGEPLLRRGWLERTTAAWAERLAAAGVRARFAVLTNGTCIDRRVVGLVRRLGAGISVSLDGVGAVQDRVRPAARGRPSFPRVAAGLEQLLDAGVTPYVLVTLSDANADGLAALGAWLMDRGLAFRVSLERDLRGGTVRGADPVHAALDELYRAIERRLPLGYPLLERHRLCDLSLRRPVRRACGAGETHLALGHDGRVAACQASLDEVGRVPTDGEDLIDAARDPRLGRAAPCAACAACPLHAACAGGCPLLLARREGADGQSPYCDLFRAFVPRLIELGALDWLRREAAGAAKEAG